MIKEEFVKKVSAERHRLTGSAAQIEAHRSAVEAEDLKMVNPSQPPSFSKQHQDEDDRLKDSPVNRTYVPIICLPNLDGTCKEEKTGCHMYHSNQLWYWQYRKHDSKWSSLPLNQAKEIDKAFYGVSADTVALSFIPEKSSNALESGSYKVCFSTMTITNADGSITYDIRRLSTVSSAKSDTKRPTQEKWRTTWTPRDSHRGHLGATTTTTKRATTFEWFFEHREVEAEWELIDDYKRIESQFLSFPTSTITVSHNGSRYRVYLSKMAGKNISTGEKRRICRRPKMEDEISSSLIESPLSRSNIPVICVLFLNGMCKGHESGCCMYHTDQPWVWQLKSKGQKSKFPLFVAKGIEQAYCNVSVDMMKLPPMPSKFWSILGKGSCKLCFSSMTITNSNESVTYDGYRLSTPSSIKSNSKNGTTFQWFLCKGGEWELIDGHRNIESEFVSSPFESITFSHKGSSFQMSFSKMIGKNLDTGESVCVRRRPKMGAEVVRKVKNAVPPALSSLPQFWERSEDKDGVMLVPLDPQCKEALKVRKRVLFTLGKVRNVKIVRVQNPRIFRELDNKMTERKRMNKNSWIHSLFHCPQPDQVETICRDNFSPNLQMTNIPQDCGKGTYFFISAALAGRFCAEDTRGGSVLMLADVFIGAVTRGNPSLAGPPKKPAKGVVFSPCVGDLMKGKKGVENGKHVVNTDIESNETTENECGGLLIIKETENKFGHSPNSGKVYDTVVDDTDLPEIFVKYSKRDYCPMYIITYS